MEDPALVARLRDLQLPLDVCPTSNICLKVFPALEDHPLPDMLAAGLNVTLNSDAPPLFNTTLTEEYWKAVHHLGLDLGQLQGLVRNAIRATTLPLEQHQALLDDFARETQLLVEEYLTS